MKGELCGDNIVLVVKQLPKTFSDPCLFISLSLSSFRVAFSFLFLPDEWSNISHTNSLALSLLHPVWW